MPHIKIPSRWNSNTILWEGEAVSLGDAVRKAVVAGAYLAGANLADADLAGANLADADLADADLAGANLAGAYLAGANLAGANLAGANLAGANLAGAYLAGAYLAGANLAGARKVDTSRHVEPIEPYVRKSMTRHEHAARYRARHPDVPVVENLDQRILDVITSGGGTLDMGAWHSCGTTHCRGGWAVHLAGEAGYALEAKLGGTERAARAIYHASTGRAPHFYASNARAFEDIKACAAREKAQAAPATEG